MSRTRVRYVEVESTIADMDDLISELNNLIKSHELYTGSPDMISYHLRRAVEYCKRVKDDELKMVNGAED